MTGVNPNRNTRRIPPCSPNPSARNVAEALKSGLKLNKARAECLAAVIIAAVEAGSIRLDDVAKRLPGTAKAQSKYHRLQDFFREVPFDYAAIARMVLGFVARLTPKPLVAAIDRTGRKTRGGHEYNIRVLSVGLGDMGLPILWGDWRRSGNALLVKRQRLAGPFLRLFGVQRPGGLMGDREFIGRARFAWLPRKRVPFLMRLRKNNRIGTADGPLTRAQNLFRHLRSGEVPDLGRRRAFQTRRGICAMRLSSGELPILGYHDGLDGSSALAMYRRRWNIEVGFEKLKTHGFHLASSRLYGDGKIERVWAALALASAWSYAGGAWSAEALEPIKRKKHGRREQSLFRRGLDLLGGYFHGIAVDLRRTGQFVFSVLRAAANATG